MAGRKHDAYYRMQQNGHEMSAVKTTKQEASGGASGYPEPYDIDVLEEADGDITMAVKRCTHQVGNLMRGSVLTDLSATFETDNIDVYSKIDTSDNFKAVALVAYPQGTAVPEADLEDGKYYFKALYGIGFDEDSVFGVVLDLRYSMLANLS